MEWSPYIVALALLLALLTQPWRLLRNAGLVTPLLAALVIQPWLWALPRLHQMPLQLQWSGACLVTLVLGWPLAVLVFCITGVASALIAPQAPWAVIDTIAWLGVVPATLALGLGALLRRWVGTHPFVYILGRAFLGTAVCMFLAGALSQGSGHLLTGIDGDLSLVARWLMAWGDAFVTGLCAAVFVAFKPQWLATWSDALYLKQAHGDGGNPRS